MFKGKEQKLELLDYALLTGNSYVITKIIVFLQETLKSSIFFYELARRTTAVSHYLIYLRNTEQTDSLMNALNVLGRHEDTAFSVYFRAVQSNQSSDNQLRLLHKAAQHFTSGELSQWHGYILEHVHLLEQQMPIEEDDKRTEEIVKAKCRNLADSSVDETSNHVSAFLVHPRPQLIGMSVLETLSYCALFHYYLQDNNFASPTYVRKRFALNEKQYLYTLLQALSKSKMWPEVDNLFEYRVSAT